MDLAAILFNPFEQIVNTTSIEGPMWKLVKTGQVVSEQKTFNDYTIYTWIKPSGKDT